MGSIADNLQAVRGRISSAARAASREPGAVSLLAVSKTHAPALIREAHAAGQRAFGENYVQEARRKDGAARRLADGMAPRRTAPEQQDPGGGRAFSMGAHRRPGEDRAPPVRAAPGRARPARGAGAGECLGRGRPRAASRRARRRRWRARWRCCRACACAASWRCPSRRRMRNCSARAFRELRGIFESLRREGLALDTLSMGMSDDMEAAIAEGSTMVRIGTAIFGQRSAGGSSAPHDPPAPPRPSQRTSLEARVHRRRQHGKRADRRADRQRDEAGRNRRGRKSVPAARRRLAAKFKVRATPAPDARHVCRPTRWCSP